MSKKWLAAALAAAFIASGGVAAAGDGAMQDITNGGSGSTGADLVNSSATTKTVQIADNEVTAAPNTAATYTVNEDNTLNIGNGKTLTVTGSTGSGIATLEIEAKNLSSVDGYLNIERGGKLKFDGSDATTNQTALTNGGTITNDGVIELGYTIYTNNGGAIDNSSTYGRVDSGISFNVANAASTNAILAAVVAGGNNKVGNLTLTGVLADDITLTGVTQGGIELEDFDMSGDKSADFSGADIAIIGTSFTPAADADEGKITANSIQINTTDPATFRELETTGTADGAGNITILSEATFSKDVTATGLVNVNAKSTFEGAVIADSIEVLTDKSAYFTATSSLGDTDTVVNNSGKVYLAANGSNEAVFSISKINNNADTNEIILTNATYGDLGTIGNDKGTLVTGAATTIGSVNMGNGSIFLGTTDTTAAAVTGDISIGNVTAKKITFDDSADSNNLTKVTFTGEFTTGTGTDNGLVNSKKVVFDDGSEYIAGDITNLTDKKIELSSQVTGYSDLLAATDNQSDGVTTGTIAFTAKDAEIGALAVKDGSEGTLTVDSNLSTGADVNFNEIIDAKDGKVVVKANSVGSNPYMNIKGGISSESDDADAITLNNQKIVVSSVLAGNTKVTTAAQFDSEGFGFTGDTMTVDGGDINITDGAVLSFGETNEQTLDMDSANDIKVADTSKLIFGANAKYTGNSTDNTIQLMSGSAAAEFDLGMTAADFEAAVEGTVASTDGEGTITITGEGDKQKDTDIAINASSGNKFEKIVFKTDEGSELGEFISTNNDVEIFKNSEITFTDAYSAGTGDTDIQEGATAIFEAGATSKTIDIQKGALAVFEGGATSDTITIRAGNALEEGGAGAFQGIVNANVDVESYGVFASVGTGATIKGAVDMAENSILHIGDDDSVTPGSASVLKFDGGSLNLANTTIIDVDEDVAKDKQLIADLGRVTVDGYGTALEWFREQSEMSMTQQTAFGSEDGVILMYTGTERTRSQAGDTLRQIAARNGAGDAGELANGRFADYLFSAVNDDLISLGTPEADWALDILQDLGKTTGTLKGRAFEAAIQHATGQDLVGTLEAVQDTVRNFNRAVTNRAYNLGNLGADVMYDECGNLIGSCAGMANRIWAGYSGYWGKASDRNGDRGYNYDAHGINVGFDRVTASGFSFGGAFGYSSGDYENKMALWDDSDIKNYSFSLFGSWHHRSGFFTSLVGSYTYSDYNMRGGFKDNLNNDVNTRSDYHSNTWSIGGTAGYDFLVARNFTLTPSIGLFYYNTRTNHFDTQNGMNRNLRYRRHEVEMPIEVTAKYDIEVACDSTLSLVANVGYSYNFSDRGTRGTFNAVVDGAAMDVEGRRPGHSGWNVGGGVQYRYRNFDVGVNYEYYGRRAYKGHSLNINAGISF